MMHQSFTSNQAKRHEFAQKVATLLSEMDDLLIDEASEKSTIRKEKLAEILFRKIHIGGIPYCVKRTPAGSIEPNPRWVAGGYFEMNSELQVQITR